LVDVASGAMHWHGNLPFFRFFLGLMLGFGVGAVLSLWPVRLSTAQDATT
jgi:hypothetical protein